MSTTSIKLEEGSFREHSDFPEPLKLQLQSYHFFNFMRTTSITTIAIPPPARSKIAVFPMDCEDVPDPVVVVVVVEVVVTASILIKIAFEL